MRYWLPFKRPASKKEWYLLIVCIIIIVVLLADISFRRVYSNFSELKRDISLAESKLGRLISILSQGEQIRADYKDAVRGFRQIKAPEDFLQEIENLAKRTGLNIRNIKPTVAKDEDLYKIYSARIEAQNNIDALSRFIYTLTEEFKGIGIQQLSINAASDEELPKIILLISSVALKE